MNRLVLSFVILFIACETSNPVAELVNDVRTYDQSLGINDTIALERGTSQIIGDTAVEIGFSRILADSRCPSDVICVWQGIARIAVWLKEPGLDTLYLEPTIYGYVEKNHTGSHTTVLSDRFGVSLLQLDPYPGVTSIVVGDTVATLRIEEFVPPLDQSIITLVAGEEYERIANSPVDPFGIDSLTVEGDTLLVHLNYSGGCNQHDFYTFGSLAWKEGQPPIMPITIVHMGHNDFCDAVIHKTIKISLDPVTLLTGYGNEVFIEPGPSSRRVYFTW